MTKYKYQSLYINDFQKHVSYGYISGANLNFQNINFFVLMMMVDVREGGQEIN